MVPLKIEILPSLLAADVGRLAEACRAAEAAGADGLHVDIMDGRFVPNLSMGPDVVRMARNETRLPLSVHLMLMRPDWLYEAFVSAGATTILVHAEAACDHRSLFSDLKRRGVRAGVVLNPETPAEAGLEFAGEVDEILCMTVHPGFGGQRFIPNVLPKIRFLRERLPELAISVDGGLDEQTAPQAAAAGANVFLVGTSLFGGSEPIAARIARLRQRIEEAFCKKSPR